jgi:hypothetical protein
VNVELRRNGNRVSRRAELVSWSVMGALAIVGCGTTEVGFEEADGRAAEITTGPDAAGEVAVLVDGGALLVDASSADAASSTDAARGIEAATGTDRGVPGMVDAGLADGPSARDAEGGANAQALNGDAASLDPCGYPPDTTPDPLLARTRVSGWGFVNFAVSPKNEIVELHTTLTVPAKPPPSGTLFLWTGLQPAVGARNYQPIDNGVLQPVLTWGPTCAPRSPQSSYASWWISPQYVNTFGHYPGYTGCLGAAGLNVEPGEELDLRMTLEGTVWRQVVRRLNAAAASASFDIDMLGQAQNYAEFLIELAGQRPVTDVVFTSTTFTMASPEPAACQPNHRGAADEYATPHASADGRTCCVSRIALRAQGVPATTP